MGLCVFAVILLFHKHPNPPSLSPLTCPQTPPALLCCVWWSLIFKATVATAKKEKQVTAHKCSLIFKWHWDILISTVMLYDELSEDLEF